MEEPKIFRPEIRTFYFNINCLENDKSVNFNVKHIARDFSAYFSSLAENLVSKFPNPNFPNFPIWCALISSMLQSFRAD